MSNPVMEICGRKIGVDYEPLVIVEIGINHEGSLIVAKEMVDAAKEAGAEMIKHQTHVIDDEMSKEAKEIIPGNTDVSIHEVMSRCALSQSEELELMQYVEDSGMTFISTAFSRAAADRLAEMNVPAIKIGSGECNNYPLIRYVAKLGKPMIVSTGMNDIDSIQKTVNILREEGISFALLHCTNIYPTPPELVRLGAMVEMQAAFPDAVVGLSDHTITNYPCMGAVALGASVLERHFTDDMSRKGPDIVCSMDPVALAQLIEGCHLIHQSGGGKKEPLAEEQATIDFAFATVVTTKAVRAGDQFTEDNIWVKRPGTGELSAEQYEEVVGKTALSDIGIDEHVKIADVAGW